MYDIVVSNSAKLEEKNKKKSNNEVLTKVSKIINGANTDVTE